MKSFLIKRVGLYISQEITLLYEETFPHNEQLTPPGEEMFPGIEQMVPHQQEISPGIYRTTSS